MPSVADLVEDHLLRALTDPETYDAGRALAEHGAVTFDQFEPMVVRARVVDDAEGYLVDLHVGPGRLAWSCSEPGGSRGLFCSHCVAAAIATWRQAPARATAMPDVPELVTSPPAPSPAAPADPVPTSTPLATAVQVVLFGPPGAPAAGLYLRCDDLEATLAELSGHGLRTHTPIRDEVWGRVTGLVLPSGTELPLYQPR